MSDVEKTSYEKPALERYGEFRELTRLTAGDLWCDMYGIGCDKTKENDWS